jgi:polar amino acid transport system permease protein
MFEFLGEYLPDIANGLALTLEITIFGVFVGLVLGILLALGEIYGGKVASILIRIYVEFFRGSPLIIQLLIAQYTIPTLLSIRISPYVTAFAIFALNSAAYQKGYMKGALETVSNDQMQAGLSVGMSGKQTLWHVVLPQALRIVIPAWSNEFCSLTKSTSALGFVGFMDLTGAGLTILGQKYIALQAWVVIAAIYLAWIVIFTKIADIIYERKKIPGLEISPI